MGLKIGAGASNLLGAMKTVVQSIAPQPAPQPVAQNQAVVAPKPAQVPTPTPKAEKPAKAVSSKAKGKDDPSFSAPGKAWDDSPYNVPLPEGEYTILHALKEKFLGREGTLMLIKKSNGTSYTVTGFDYDKVCVVGSDGLAFRPRIGQREVQFYDPLWRD